MGGRIKRQFKAQLWEKRKDLPCKGANTAGVICLFLSRRLEKQVYFLAPLHSSSGLSLGGPQGQGKAVGPHLVLMMSEDYRPPECRGSCRTHSSIAEDQVGKTTVPGTPNHKQENNPSSAGLPARDDFFLFP